MTRDKFVALVKSDRKEAIKALYDLEDYDDFYDLALRLDTGEATPLYTKSDEELVGFFDVALRERQEEERESERVRREVGW
jgi:hypothetical protein